MVRIIAIGMGALIDTAAVVTDVVLVAVLVTRSCHFAVDIAVAAGAAVGGVALSCTSGCGYNCIVVMSMDFLNNRCCTDICCCSCRNAIGNTVAIQVPTKQFITITFRVSWQLHNGSTDDLCIPFGLTTEQISIGIVELDIAPFITINHHIAIVPAGEVIIPPQISFQCLHINGHARHTIEQPLAVTQIRCRNTFADNHIF